MATPISFYFRITSICLLSLFKRLLCRLKELSVIIFIIIISSWLILVLCFFLICPAEIRVRLIHLCVSYAFKYGSSKVNEITRLEFELAYYDDIVWHVNHNITGTSQFYDPFHCFNWEFFRLSNLSFHLDMGKRLLGFAKTVLTVNRFAYRGFL